MPDPLPSGIIRPEVRAASSYVLPDFDAEVKLNQNENPHEIPMELKERIVRRVLERDWGRYPDFVPTDTISRLASFTGWKEDGILVGNGSNELIYVTLIATVGPGRTVAIPQPTFAVYKLMASVLGANVVEVPLNSQDFSFDVDRMVDAARNADIVIICSPNSPTGNLLPLSGAERILKAARGLVVVDEAYHEFSGQSMFPLLRRFNNLVLLRTFSKAKAMAGLRFGYLLAQPDVAIEIQKAKLPYSVNIFTLAAADVAIEEASEIGSSIPELIAERGRLEAELALRKSVEVFPSHANFILIRTPYDAHRLFEAICSEGVLVRDVSSYPLLERALRVSVGTHQENNRFLAALDSALEAIA